MYKTGLLFEFSAEEPDEMETAEDQSEDEEEKLKEQLAEVQAEESKEMKRYTVMPFSTWTEWYA